MTYDLIPPEERRRLAFGVAAILPPEAAEAIRRTVMPVSRFQDVDLSVADTFAAFERRHPGAMERILKGPRK